MLTNECGNDVAIFTGRRFPIGLHVSLTFLANGRGVRLAVEITKVFAKYANILKIIWHSMMVNVSNIQL